MAQHLWGARSAPSALRRPSASCRADPAAGADWVDQLTSTSRPRLRTSARKNLSPRRLPYQRMRLSFWSSIWLAASIIAVQQRSGRGGSRGYTHRPARNSRSAQHIVAIAKRPARGRAGAHRDHIAWLGHLVVEPHDLRAIFFSPSPPRIIRSAWRGEARNISARSVPDRSAKGHSRSSRSRSRPAQTPLAYRRCRPQL